MRYSDIVPEGLPEGHISFDHKVCPKPNCKSQGNILNALYLKSNSNRALNSGHSVGSLFRRSVYCYFIVSAKSLFALGKIYAACAKLLFLFSVFLSKRGKMSRGLYTVLWLAESRSRDLHKRGKMAKCICVDYSLCHLLVYVCEELCAKLQWEIVAVSRIDLHKYKI